MRTVAKFMLGVILAAAFCVSSFAAENWLMDEQKAFAESKRLDQYMLVLFTGSDWCPPCMHTENAILASKEFIRETKNKIVMLYLDFPRKKAQSNDLKRQNLRWSLKYKIRSYPTMILLDPEGKEVARMDKPFKKPIDCIKWLRANSNIESK